VADTIPWDPLLSSPEAYSVYARLRGDAPVCRMELPNGLPTWLVTRFDDAVGALGERSLRKDPDVAREFWQRHGVGLDAARQMCLAPTMLATDPPVHTRLRSSVASVFAARRASSWEASIADAVRRLLDAVADRESFCVVEALAAPLPMHVLANVLGVPAGQEADFRAWASSIVAHDSETPESRLDAAAALGVHLLDLMAAKRAAPGEDLISSLVALPDDRLSDFEALTTLFLLLIAGYETTVNLIGNTVLALLRHPAERQRLESNWGLLDPAIEEATRYWSPVAIASWRFAERDVEIAGQVVPAGDPVRVVLASANRDERTFPDPDRFDITRRNDHHVGFGQGSHFCLGASLDRLEVKLAVGGLFRRYPGLRLAADPADLRWKQSHIMRGLQTLPVAP